MAEIKIDIINQMKDALIQSLLKDGIVLPVWHDVKTDPPKEDDRYLVCNFPHWKPEGRVKISSYALNLRKVDDLEFDEEKPGWWFYDNEWGYREEGPFDYWMPLPKLPKKE